MRLPAATLLWAMQRRPGRRVPVHHPIKRVAPLGNRFFREGAATTTTGTVTARFRRKGFPQNGASANRPAPQRNRGYPHRRAQAQWLTQSGFRLRRSGKARGKRNQRAQTVTLAAPADDLGFAMDRQKPRHAIAPPAGSPPASLRPVFVRLSATLGRACLAVLLS